MAFTKFTTEVENVQALNDRPNSNSGLTADQVKAVFDQAGSDIKTYINDTLTPELDSNSGLNLGIFNLMSYGSLGNGTTDDAPSLRAAVAAISAAGGGKLIIPKPSVAYLLGSWDTTIASDSRYYICNLPSNITIEGEGYNSLFKVKDNIYPTASMANYGVNVFGAFSKTNVKLSKIRIDFNGANNLQPATSNQHTFFGLKGMDSSYFEVSDCFFDNCPGANVLVFGGTGNYLTIKNNTLNNGGRAITGNVNNTDFSFMYSEWTNSGFINNRIFQAGSPISYSGGIELHGSNSYTIGNYIKGCEPAIWIASTPNAIENIIVTNNEIVSCHRGIAFWRSGTLKKVIIANNIIGLKYYSDMTGDRYCIGQPRPSDGVWGGSVANGGVLDTITINDNILFGEDNVLTVGYGYGIVLSSIKDVKIHDNQIDNLNGGSIYIQGSPYGLNMLSIKNNKLSNWGLNSGLFSHECIFFDFTGTSTTPAVSNFLENDILVEGNTIAQDSVRSPATIVYAVSYTTGNVTNLIVKDNMLNANTGTLFSGTQGAATNWSAGFYYHSQLQFRANGAPTITAPRGTLAWHNQPNDNTSTAFLNLDGATNWRGFGFFQTSGTTAQRPTGLGFPHQGLNYRDTTIGKVIWWTGTGWVDSNLTAV